MMSRVIVRSTVDKINNTIISSASILTIINSKVAYVLLVLLCNFNTQIKSLLGQPFKATF